MRFFVVVLAALSLSGCMNQQPSPGIGRYVVSNGTQLIVLTDTQTGDTWYLKFADTGVSWVPLKRT